MLEFLREIGKNKELESIIRKLQSNCENNYKDAAQANLKEFEMLYAQLCEKNALSTKQVVRYEEILKQYREQMEKFTHKDQKPYWT